MIGCINSLKIGPVGTKLLYYSFLRQCNLFELDWKAIISESENISHKI